MSIVLDASLTLSWCFPDEQTPASLGVLDRLKAGEQAAQVAGPVQRICRDHGLTPYDALYVELALRALATLDERQQKAARALGIACL